MSFPRRFALLSLFCAACHVAETPADVLVERRLSVMGTWLELSVRGPDRARALADSEHAVRALEEAEARLSTWIPDSELARLNRAPVGEPFALSPALAHDLARVAQLWRATDGAFDPGLGALVEAWGLRSGGRRPSNEELERARAVGGFAAFELQGTSAVRRHPLAAIEEGGFGKGIGLDAALAALAEAGVREAVLDLGGQFALLGSREVVIGLADPRARERSVLELHIDRGSLATSGNSEHGMLVDGVPLGHILDPHTGRPAPDFGSLSVWASDATTADCLSKLYVLGPERALEWARAHRSPSETLEVLALVVADGHLTARATPGWRGRIVALVPELEIRFTDESTSSGATAVETRR